MVCKKINLEKSLCRSWWLLVAGARSVVPRAGCTLCGAALWSVGGRRPGGEHWCYEFVTRLEVWVLMCDFRL